MAGVTNWELRAGPLTQGQIDAVTPVLLQSWDDVEYDWYEAQGSIWLSLWVWDASKNDWDELSIENLLNLLKVPWRAATERRDDYDNEWWDSEGNTGGWDPFADFPTPQQQQEIQT